MITYNGYFPRQKVSSEEKQKQEWYANCIDYVIAAGISFNDRSETETQLNILHGDIPNSFYKKTLNPYNSNNERYTRFPATMRNLDIMNDIVRRYVSEYFKGVHEFIVSANNPDVVLRKNAKLRQAIGMLAEQEFANEFRKRLQALQQQQEQQQMQQGGEAPDINPQDVMPDPEEFMKNFNEKYIDSQSKQAQDLLDYVRSITEDAILYISAYFNYVSVGECYTYTDVRGEKLIKENVPVIEAYPIPNSNFFVEDHDMFARKMLLSYPQIMDMFETVLDDKDKAFLEKYYDTRDASTGRTQMLYSQYFEYYPDGCEKLTKEEREFFKKQPVNIAEQNNNLFEVWHVVWRGEVRRGVLTYINQFGVVSERIVDDDYVVNPLAGDISIDYIFEEQIYEGYRIGNRYSAVYPIKARPVAYQRDGKLPYNGMMEILPLMGKFSIIKLITPYQIMRNIISYHREMVIAKNKMLILLLPESLITSDTEDKIYKMAADGVLLVDDSEDANSQKMANIRMLNANLGTYITELTNLMEAIKQEAREMVDMNMQRYGEITQSAGSGTTQEAISRSSMGTVIIVTMFDEMRRRDYQRDIDFGKLAYIDGLQTSFYDDKYNQRYISLDVDSFVNSDCSVIVKNDQKELGKLENLKQWAFSAAQNGELDMALAAIKGDNVTQITETINRFSELRRQHEEQLKQADQMLEQAKQQNELAKIQAKGEQDRLTKELEYQYEMQLKDIDANVSLMTHSNRGDASDTIAKARLQEISEQNKMQITNQKLNIEQNKMANDMYNKAADRQVQREKMQNDLAIAKTNKNKYDKK